MSRIMEDLSGKRFGQWVVQWPVGRNHSGIWWLCLCDCGNLVSITGNSLREEKSTKCRTCSMRRFYKHGLARRDEHTLEITMWYAARKRAKQDSVVFNIVPQDIVIPEKCPLLGITLEKSKTHGPCFSSPTLDRKIPELGYTKDNIQVISSKANRIKNDASLEEIELLVRNWRAQS